METTRYMAQITLTGTDRILLIAKLEEDAAALRGHATRTRNRVLRNDAPSAKMSATRAANRLDRRAAALEQAALNHRANL